MRRAIIQSTPEMPSLVLKWLRRLRRDVNGRRVDQLTHSLQTATLAFQAGAADDIIVAALCHDIGKAVSWVDHGRRSADIIKPYVTSAAYWVVAAHDDFLAVYNINRSGLDPYAFREKHARRRWYKTAVVFADEWDSMAYDPTIKPLSLRYFEPLIRRVFAATRRRAERDTGLALIQELESVIPADR
ncbi:MAG: HD domain-containing protein [Hyphomicrobiales bacterium]|nr:HD domain-containing protein [Hyphomicrobiales bacterium]MBV8823459.1 HD domain-containing protein [Hyphomicrobiales bacterium]